MNSDRTPPAGSPPASPPASFEVALSRLEKLVRELEGGHLSLEQSLASFEEGMELVRRCAHELKQIEARVKVLTEETGRIIESDWAADDTPAPGSEGES